MKYFFEDLKAICSQSVSVKFNGEYYSLEPKYGKITFTFKEKIDRIKIFFKRISGNGKIIINDIPYTIASTHNEFKEIFINNDIISISRTKDSVGEVAILGIELNLQELEEDVNHNWKYIVKSFNKYKGLNLVGNKLVASAGAFIEPADMISELITEPPNVYTVIEDKILFNHTCAILSVTLNENNKKIHHPTSLYHSMSPPNPSPVDEKEINNNIINNNYQKNYANTVDNFNISNKVIYNSDTVRGLNQFNFKANKFLKFINTNNKHYIVVKQHGIFSIPISGIKSGSNYIVHISGKSISGNGRIRVSIGAQSDMSYGSSLIFGVMNQENFVKIKVNNSIKDHDIFRLNIGMLDDGIGEVLISKVVLIDDSDDLDDKSPYTSQYLKNVINSSESSNNFIKNNIKTNTIQPTIQNNLVYNSFNFDKKFVIVIPSYKNSEWAEKNILSALNQNYKDYRVLFTDDCSPDNTFDVVASVVNMHPHKDKVTLIKNPSRKGALENLYNMIHSCDDDEIILTLDGDDWLHNNEVLNKLNNYYKNDVWMTYGQYQNYPDGGTGIAQQIPLDVIKNSSYRRYHWCSSHLRTFYAWLFKQIKKEHFFYEGNFMSMTWDMAMMFPMLEMSGHRSKFISEFLYTYNLSNPINDHKVNQKLQQKLDRLIRGMTKYPLLHREPENVLEIKNKKIKIGLLIIATGKYDVFVDGLIKSADKFYFNDSRFEVTYFIFSDKNIKLETNRNYKLINIEHKGFPYASMDRFKHFVSNEEMLSESDYLYYIDVDCRFVDNVSHETIGNLVGVKHCGYINGGGTFEDNKNSVFYAPHEKYKYYFGGGFSGGKSKNYLDLSKWCYEMIEKDLSNEIMPRWHDETALNKYFLDNEPDVVLSPSYHYPENDKNYIAKWKPNKFEPKILLLEKKHNEIR